MKNFKITGKKADKTVFCFVVADNWKDALDAAESALARGFTKTIKRLDKIIKIELVDEDVIIGKRVRVIVKPN